VGQLVVVLVEQLERLLRVVVGFFLVVGLLRRWWRQRGRGLERQLVSQASGASLRRR
jgi:hypothetical protein